MTASARFEAAQAKAARPGSAVLMRWLSERGGVERAGLAQNSVVTGADSAVATTWAGMDWSQWVRGNAFVSVNENTARSVSAVVACTNLIGGSIATLPLHFYQRMPGDERQRAQGGLAESLWWLFNERPHPDWSAAAFWNYISDSRLLHGDGFAIIGRGGRAGAEPTSFEPRHPDFVDVQRIDGRLLYTFWPQQIGERVRVLEADDVLHIPGQGFNGLRSLSQLKFGLLYPAGIASAADQQAAEFMADGARPDFAVEMPATNLSLAQREQYRQQWMERHSGKGSKKAPVILAGGVKLHQLTVNPEDAQLLTTRSFQVEEICRIFGVPPHMVGHTEKTTSWGSGIEQQSIGFVTYTLQRHLAPVEQELNHKLFKTSRNFAEFQTAGLLRGDTKTRFEAYRIALGRAGERPWIKPSEIRRIENMKPDDSIDQVVNPPDQTGQNQGGA